MGILFNAELTGILKKEISNKEEDSKSFPEALDDSCCHLH
jgi:hypothetical protein